MKMQNTQQRLDQLLIETIDEALSSLGEPVKNHIYDRLENEFSITKYALPQQIGEFSKLLYNAFGPHAGLIEIKCMKTFYSKIKIDLYLKNPSITWDDKDFNLLNYTNKLRADS
jgi:hypothetical protein